MKKKIKEPKICNICKGTGFVWVNKKEGISKCCLSCLGTGYEQLPIVDRM